MINFIQDKLNKRKNMEKEYQFIEMEEFIKANF